MSNQEIEFCTYRLRVIEDMPESEYKNVLRAAVESRLNAMKREASYEVL